MAKMVYKAKFKEEEGRFTCTKESFRVADKCYGCIYRCCDGRSEG